MLKLLLTVVVFLQLLLQSECLYVGDKCFDDGQRGTCISLWECKPLVEQIRRAGNPMPAYMRQKLQKLNCGFELQQPVVCCVSSNTITGEHDFGTHLHGVVVPHTSKPTDSMNFAGSGEQSTESNDNVEDFTRRTPLENKSGPPNIEGHQNIGLLPKQCGSIDSDRIWGGNRTRLYEMPWMVLLSYDSARGMKLSCGGTVISEWYVLTAAHCVSFLSGNLRLDGVILGEYDVRQDPDCEMSDGVQYCAPNIMNITVDSVIAHPGYTPQTLADDIALIRLSRPADFKLDNIKPLCLPSTRDLQSQSLSGLNGVVAGWGVTEDGLQSPVLLSVDLPILLPNECQDAYNGSLKIRNSQICAGGVKDKDSCGGDSGGPLMYPGQFENLGVRYIQRGIVSFGSKRCGIAGYPGIYTNVAYYMDWILDNMRR